MLDTTQDRDGDSSDVSKPVEDPSISSHTDEVPGGLRITDEVLVVSSHTDEVTSLPSDTFAVTQVASHSDEVPRNFEEDPKTVVAAKYSLADRMETLASTRTHNQGIQCTTELRREDGEDRTAWRTEGTIDAEVTEATVNDHVQQQHVPEQPAESRTRTATPISRQGKERHETEEQGRRRTPAGVHPRQFGATAESERRAASTSSKQLVEHGILPLVLVLRWQRQGNHLQAITYPEHRRIFDGVPYDSIKTARTAACELKALRKMTSDQTTSSEAKDSSEGGTTPSDTAKRSGEESNAEELTKEEHENKRGANVSHKENHCNEEITDKTTTQGNSAARDQNHDVHD
ncbi:hypothetical protein Pcac1_g5958 [Phytophthora cactorum]|nr:hypothetical protein Pcac1_g5958 [Phytophthora cactorum]KAG2839334.1 hypothetical protein PC111_g3904 [Phytophthora cactorum]